MRLSVIGALALGLSTGCVIGSFQLSSARATSSPALGPIVAASAGAAITAVPQTTGATAPVLMPMQTLLMQLQNTGEILASSNDIVVHSRTVDNSYDAATGEKRIGFTGVVSPLGLSSQVSAGPDSSNAIAMSMGIGIFRGLRPRLTTHVIAGGAEGSTLVAYANQNTQWLCLVEGSLVSGKRGTFQLLTGAVTRNFVDNMTIVVASRANPTQPWSVDGPRALTTAERSICQTAWTKAQNAGIIPGTEPFPP